jgi:outer membrane protein assembly factor BamA
MSLVDAALPVAGVALDPLASPTQLPRRGLLGTLHLGYGFGRVEGALDTPGPARGFALSAGLDVSDQATGSTESLYEANYSATGYIPMPWAKNHVLALRSAGGVSGGSFARRGVFYVGGYTMGANTVVDTVTAGTYNGAFVLRGYPARAYSGSTYSLQTAELRFPIAVPDRGLSTLPLYLRRIDGNLYADFGGAFDSFDTRAVRLFHRGSAIWSPQLHTGVGGELWFGTTLGYLLDVTMRLGYALGFSAERIPGGQAYFLAASAF